MKDGYEKFVNDPFAVRSKLFEKKKLRNFKALSAKDSDYGKYLIDIDPMLSDQDILIEIEQFRVVCLANKKFNLIFHFSHSFFLI